MFGPEVVWVNNFGLVRAVSALYALSTLSVLREAAGAQLSRYRSAARGEEKEGEVREVNE